MKQSVKEKIWTAKWLAEQSIVKNNRSNLVSARDLLELALSEYDESSNLIISETEPERPDAPPDVDGFDIPKVVERPIDTVNVDVKWQSKGKYLTKSGMPIGLVVHYTVSGRTHVHARNVCKYFADTPKTLGYQIACPVMDEKGRIYKPMNWNLIRDRNNHAGKSNWKGMTDLSSKFCGIEICSWGKLDDRTKQFVKESDIRWFEAVENIQKGEYEAFTNEQEMALIQYCFYLKRHCPEFSFENVVGHDEIAPGRKSDPGGSLSITMPTFRNKLNLIYNHLPKT